MITKLAITLTIAAGLMLAQQKPGDEYITVRATHRRV